MKRITRFDAVLQIAALCTAAGLLTALPAGAGAQAAPHSPDPQAAMATADRLVASNPPLMHRSPKEKITRSRVVTGAHGLQYVSYERSYAGLPVLGDRFVVVTDATGRVLSTANAQQTPLSLSTTPTITEAAAAGAARGRLKTATGVSRPRLVVLPEGAGRLAYETIVDGSRGDLPSRLHVFTDAHTGKPAGASDEIVDAVGNGYHNGKVAIATTHSATLYGMSDPTRPGVRCGGMDGRTYTDADDVWGNGTGTDLVTGCVDAMYDAQQEWDMLHTWLGRNGIDGNGRGFAMRVGLPAVNAFWSQGNLVAEFGVNKSHTAQATALDVVGHELGHAIWDTSGGVLQPSDDIPELNESTGDIFGALTEWFANNPVDPPDFLVGEKVNLVNTGPIRIMYNPALVGDPNCYSSAVPTMEPHMGAGVQNHWFYLLAAGSNANDPAHGHPNSPTCNGKTVSGIGIQKAGMVYMETLNRSTGPWSHGLARFYSLQAAKDLFQSSCTEFASVRAAWDAVNVPAQAGEATCTDPRT